MTRYSKEFKQKIINEYINNKTINQIAKENNIPISTIYDWIKPPKIKASNLILEIKEIQSYQLLEISQLSPKQQEVELYQLLEELQNTIFDTLPNISEQHLLLNNTSSNIPKQTINFINNVENYNKLSNQKSTNLKL